MRWTPDEGCILVVEELDDFMSYCKRDGETFIVERSDDEYVVGRVGQEPEAFTAEGIREFISQATMNGFAKVTIIDTRPQAVPLTSAPSLDG